MHASGVCVCLCLCLCVRERRPGVVIPQLFEALEHRVSPPRQLLEHHSLQWTHKHEPIYNNKALLQYRAGTFRM